MPARDGHFQQARDNRRFANELLDQHKQSPCAMQWAVTTTFYAAVHCIEGHLATFGEHTGQHADRDALMVVSRFAVPPGVFEAYKRLKGWSVNGRYEMRRFSAFFVKDRALVSLAVITQFVQLDG